MVKKIVCNFWALLPLVAVLLLVSCSNSDDVLEPTPGNNNVKKMRYTVSASYGGDTRATVGEDHKTLYFQSGDKLAVKLGDAILGMLTLQSGAGSTQAVFAGELSGETLPTPSDVVTVILIGENQKGINTTTGAITYGTTFLASLEDAVKEYSYLTDTGSFNAQGGANFQLTQQTAFLSFIVTFKDKRTTAATPVAISVANGEKSLASGTVTTEASGTDVVAKLTVPVAAGTTLENAKITVAGELISFGSGLEDPKLTGRSYVFKKNAGHPSVPLWPDGPEFSEEDLDYFYQWGDPTPYTAEDATEKRHAFAYKGEEAIFYYLENGYAGSITTEMANSPGNYKWQGAGQGANMLISLMNSRLIKYCQTDKTNYWCGTGSPDGKTVLDPEDDAATVNWGGDWRMPTIEEIRMLIEQTTQSLVVIEGKRYCRFTSKTWPDNYIDFPFNGYLRNYEYTYDQENSLYLTASLHTWEPIFAWNMWIQTDGVTVTVNAGATTNDPGGPGDLARASRASGRPVRPVRDGGTAGPLQP